MHIIFACLSFFMCCSCDIMQSMILYCTIQTSYFDIFNEILLWMSSTHECLHIYLNRITGKSFTFMPHLWPLLQQSSYIFLFFLLLLFSYLRTHIIVLTKENKFGLKNVWWNSEISGMIYFKLKKKKKCRKTRTLLCWDLFMCFSVHIITLFRRVLPGYHVSNTTANVGIVSMQ